MTASPPPDSSEELDPASRARSAGIGATASLLLAVPFLFFGLWTLNTRARVELKCAPGGPCAVTRSSWLSKEEVGPLPLEDIRGGRVDRNRKSRGDGFIFRPVLETARGDVPLSYAWMEDERRAHYPIQVVTRYMENPFGGGVTLWQDDRQGPTRLGGSFTIVGAGLLGFGLWLLQRWRQLRAKTPESPRAPAP